MPDMKRCERRDCGLVATHSIIVAGGLGLVHVCEDHGLEEERDHGLGLQPLIRLVDFEEEAARTIVGPWSERERRLVFACGLAGEAGEVADLVKKFEGHGEPVDAHRLASELGDVLWYVAAVGRVYGVTLEDAAQANIAKRARRHPDGFTQAGAQAKADLAPGTSGTSPGEGGAS